MTDTQNLDAKTKIIIKGARQHNLKNVSLEIPRNKLIVFTGVSGSGKSSLVFDTIYAEGQRRYLESLSSYARQFLERISKPDIDFIYGISPAVAIEQKTGTRNARSTVGTTTEIYDYLRLLYARIGKTYCFNCGKVVKKDTVGTVTDWLSEREEGEKFYLGMPLHAHEGRTVKEEIEAIKKRGFFRIYLNDQLIDLNETPKTPRSKKFYVILDRFKISKGDMRGNIAESVETSFKEGEGRLVVISADKKEIKEFNRFYECCGIKYEEPEPRFFSFNNPFGACPVCQGFGRTIGIDMDLVIPDKNKTIMEGAIAPWRTPKYTTYLRELARAAKDYKIPINIPFRELTDEHVELIKKGTKEFTGIDEFFKSLESKTYKLHIRVLLSKYRGYTTCSACKGSRLRREALQVKIENKSIYDITSMSIENAFLFFKDLKLTQYELAIGERILKETIRRLTFLNDVGLGYLTLNRLSSQLSGGETQRINLASSLGSSLIGALYVLDEPSVGLHPRDGAKLIRILKSLKDLGNSVLVVEHDADMMRESDLIVDVGPKAGTLGGEIIFKGTYEEILKDEKSITGQYLSGKKRIPLPEKYRTDPTPFIKITGARENNLKNLNVEIPLRKFVAVTGVSGSGKSTLVHDIVYGGLAKLLGENPPKIGKYADIEGYQQIDSIEIVDQSPIGKSPRSNPISYVKAFEHIRELFASTPQAKSRGYKPGYFSFNVPGGRCETCEGEGFVKIDMQFLADLYLECEDCKGTRFKKEIREITYKGKNLVDVLNMTVDEAYHLFTDHKKIEKYLRVLSQVGLGYIKLGQPSNTLSGGEAQRVKLAYNLAEQRAGRHTLFIFDEPTTGLHMDDISKLINCFNLLLKEGNSVIIIEHNLDVIKCADYIIDLGPEAGERGGELVVCGTPDEIMQSERSYTGQYLKKYLENEVIAG